MDISFLRTRNCDLYFTHDAKKYCTECNYGRDILADPRSMAYYVMGKAKTQKRQCVLICVTFELTDMLPAITEAYYQNISMTILSFGEDEYNYRIAECYHAVTHNVIVNNEFNIDTILDKTGVKLVLIKQEEKRVKYAPKEINGLVRLLLQLNPHKEFEIYSYCDMAASDIDIEIEIHEGNTFSLYEILGRAWLSDKLICLIVESSRLVESINTFNIRYVKDNLLIISIGKEISKYKDWISENGFYVNSVSSTDLLQCSLHTLPALLQVI